jgi:CRP/FNR family transcriptional regulator, cyclic AMP receptor protein
MDACSALTQIPLFADLQREDLECLSADLRRRRYSRGTVIVWRDDPGTTLYLIESGWVKVVATSQEGQVAILAVLGPGDFFGDLALLDGRPRSADVVVVEDCQLLLLERDAFIKAIEGNSRLALGIIAALAARLRYAFGLREDLSFLAIPARLARALLRLGSESMRSDETAVTLPPRLTQAELAGLVGATRESVNKWLRFYEQQGLIRRDGAQITILQPKELRKRID